MKVRGSNSQNSIYSVLAPVQDIRKRAQLDSKWIILVCLLCVLVAVLTGGFTLYVVFRNAFYSYNRSMDRFLPNFIRESNEIAHLPKSGQLFCWIMTSVKFHSTRVPAVNETWLSRCDHGQFFTNEPLHPNLKADDDTYMIVEHLRTFLSRLNSSLPYYVGYRLKPYLEHGYNAGGAGYVLSKAALKIFSDVLYKNETLCPDDVNEDVGIARCLSNVGIYPLDTRNAKGQQRPDEIFNQPNFTNPYWSYEPLYGMCSLHFAFPKLVRVLQQHAMR